MCDGNHSQTIKKISERVQTWNFSSLLFPQHFLLLLVLCADAAAHHLPISMCHLRHHWENSQGSCCPLSLWLSSPHRQLSLKGNPHMTCRMGIKNNFHGAISILSTRWFMKSWEDHSDHLWSTSRHKEKLNVFNSKVSEHATQSSWVMWIESEKS